MQCIDTWSGDSQPLFYDMKNKKFYIYNPDTDNFERHYPSIKDRMVSICWILITGLILAAGFYLIFFYFFETPTVENLSTENRELRQQYNILEKRMDGSLRMLKEIQNRDSNLYRVLLQMDPEKIEMGPNNPLSGDIAMRKMNDSRLVIRLHSKLDTLDYNLLNQAVSFNKIRDVAMHNQDRLDHTPSVLPINIKDYTMSSGYGIRIDPVYKSHKFHAGLDFAADMGTQVFATADGIVSFADIKSGYGNCIDINHGYNYVTRYAHLSKILVKPGSEVKRGELIGLVGSTGKSTGPHLHYEVHFKDKPQNPINYYFMDLTPEEYNEMIEIAENAGHVMD